MLNYILLIIGTLFVFKGYDAFEQIYPNKTHAALAVVTFIIIYKVMKSTRR
jgi:hypothetical protein